MLSSMSKVFDLAKKNRDSKKKNNSIRLFFSEGNGKYFLLFLEIVLIMAFLVRPELYYNPTVPGFFDRFYADSILICGVSWGLLVFLTLNPVNLSEEVNWVLTFLTAFLMPFFCFLLLEEYNDMQFWGPVSLMEHRYVLLDLVIYYVIFILLLLVFNSVRGAALALLVITGLFGVLNYELTVFRNMSFIASDIYSALTALAVANTYEFQMDVQTAEVCILIPAIGAALLKLKPLPLFRPKGRICFLAGCIVMCMAFLRIYVTGDLLEKQGVDFRVYRPQFKYRFYGTLLTTIRTFGYLHVRVPENYSAEEVERIAKPYIEGDPSDSTEDSAAKGEKKKQPNIICIMNESFSDLSDLGDLPVTEDAMPFVRSLKKNTIRGYTYTSVFGGNTANSEFEFLTGNTMAFLPDNSVPYQLFLRGDTAGLTRTLKDQGYGRALALHPYYNTGYSRYKVYPAMGFDRFYCSDDFSVFTDTLNYHITDKANYQKIIDLYESHDKEDGPFYMFNVTMQNHGSYTGSTLETGDAVKLTGDYSRFRKAQQFLNMIRMSDQALKELVAYFEREKEPTVILFFGDHLPDLDDGFYDALLKKSMDQLEGEELTELYRVPFLIWANYDIKERTLKRTSNNYLSVLLADAAGIRKTPYMEYLSDLQKEIPAINALGYWDKDGHFYEIGDQSSPYTGLLREYNLMEYNNLFGKEEMIKDLFYLK